MGQNLQRNMKLALPVREADSARLDSWKEIASFLHRDARTVRRWERERRLPVHRVPGGERSGVFAYVSELEHWLHTASTVLAEPAYREPNREHDPSPNPSPDLSRVAAQIELATEHAGIAKASAPEPTQAAAVSALHSVNTFATDFTANAALKNELDEQSTVKEWQPEQPFEAVVAAPREASLWRLGSRNPAYPMALLFLMLALTVGGTFAFDHYRDQHEMAAAPHQPTPEAQDLYLRGRYFWNLRTEDGLNRAVDLFTQAIVNDPGYAAAYAGLADSYLLLRQYGHMPDSEAYPRALAAAQRAVSLDNSCPDAHRSLGFILRFWNWDMPAAEKEYLRAIALDPRNSQSHHWYATALLSAGREAEALAQIDIARALEPQSVSVLADRGPILSAQDLHRGSEALQQLTQAQPEFVSPHVYLSNIDLELRDYAHYLSEARVAAILKHDAPATVLLDRASRVLAVDGPVPMLQGLARDLSQFADRGEVSAYRVARLYSLTGDARQTIRYLRLSSELRDPSFLTLDRDPAFELVRASPEYSTLLARRNAPPTAPKPVAQLDATHPF